MASLAPPTDRSSVTGAGRDAPWGSDDDLQADADTAWAVDLGLIDGDVGDSWMAGTDAVHDELGDGLVDMMSALAARS